jgi:hypothetical protein
MCILRSCLQLIIIFRSVQFIDGSAFCIVTLSSSEIECGNDRFVFENAYLIDILDHKLIATFSASSTITIPFFIDILGPSCFARCTPLSSTAFESPPRFARVESLAFTDSDIRVLLPSTLVFLTHDAHSDLFQLSLSDPGFCSVFD